MVLRSRILRTIHVLSGQLFTKEKWCLAFAQSICLECFIIAVILQNTVSVDYILENLVLINEAFIKLW